MNVNVAFKKRLGPWVYQFDIIIVNEQNVASVAGTAIIGSANNNFEVSIMVPTCIKDQLEYIQSECHCRQRELALFLEV